MSEFSLSFLTHSVLQTSIMDYRAKLISPWWMMIIMSSSHIWIIHKCPRESLLTPAGYLPFLSLSSTTQYKTILLLHQLWPCMWQCKNGLPVQGNPFESKQTQTLNVSATISFSTLYILTFAMLTVCDVTKLLTFFHLQRWCSPQHFRIFTVTRQHIDVFSPS